MKSQGGVTPGKSPSKTIRSKKTLPRDEDGGATNKNKQATLTDTAVELEHLKTTIVGLQQKIEVSRVKGQCICCVSEFLNGRLNP